MTAIVGGGVPASAADCDLRDVAVESIPAHQAVSLDDSRFEESPDLAEFRLSEDHGGPMILRFFEDTTRPAGTVLLVMDGGSVANATTGHSGILEGVLNSRLTAGTEVTIQRMPGPEPGAVALLTTATAETGAALAIYAVSGAVGRVEFAIHVIGDVQTLTDVPREVDRMFNLYRDQKARVPSGCLGDAPRPGFGDRLAQLAGATVGGALIVGGVSTVLAGVRDPFARRRWRARLSWSSRRHHRSRRPPAWAGWSVRDVTPYARRRRRRARWRIVLNLFALASTATGVVAALAGSRAMFLVLTAGVVLARLLGRVVAHTGDVGPEPRRRTPRPRGARAVGLWVAAVVAAAVAVLGFACAINWVMWVTLTDYEQAVVAVHSGFATADDYGTFVFLIGVAGIAAFVAAGALWHLARRLTAPGMHAVRAADERSPVLYLRGFDDDRMRIRVTGAGRRGWLARLSLRRRERFEELVAWILSAYGPVVAVADPRSRRRRLGAARESIQVDDWLSVVRDRMREASTIVVTVGGTEGLAAEVAALRDEGLLSRCLFLLPPLAGESVAARWDVVAAALDRHVRLDPNDLGSTIVTLLGSQAVLYRSSARDDVGYQASLDLAMDDRARWSRPRLSEQPVA